MTGFIEDLKKNKLVINTNSKSYEASLLTGLLFIFAYSGLSGFIGLLLMSMLGNSLMLPALFIAPVILFYIYTLAEDFVNPLLSKFVFIETMETSTSTEAQ